MAKPTRKRIIEALLERHGKTYATAGSPIWASVVAYVALDMIWRGTSEVMKATAGR